MPITNCNGEGCDKCDVCRYCAYLDWAQGAACAGAQIERDPEIEAILDAPTNSTD